MSKIYIPSLTYMRGLCMLGVIGIHIGSYALGNPHANAQLIAVLEILTRFCVPAFFFLSAFGLFLSTPLSGHFNYAAFIKKRMSAVLIPYLVWSVIYTFYTAYVSRDIQVIWYFPRNFVFGTTAYHLYFLVILLWFYLLMPLWRNLTRFVLKKPLLYMPLLFLLQTAFNYLSSYHGSLFSFENYWLQYAYTMRLNYWVAHYIWIFLLGALCAEEYDRCKLLLWRYRLPLTLLFSLSVTLMLGSYYYVLYERNYTLLEAIYTIHQLSPMGMLYTATGCLFFLHLFDSTPLTPTGKTFWHLLGHSSYGMYLSHPLLLFFLHAILNRWGVFYSSKVVILLYLTTVLSAFIFTQLVLNLGSPRARRLLLGA